MTPEAARPSVRSVPRGSRVYIRPSIDSTMAQFHSKNTATFAPPGSRRKRRRVQAGRESGSSRIGRKTATLSLLPFHVARP